MGVFLAIPAVADAVKAFARENNVVFWLIVVSPASVMALFTTVLAAKILWTASEPIDDYRD